MQATARALFLSALMTTVVLAGCSDAPAEGDDGPVDPDAFDLAAGKGAIAGLLLDDRYRPIHLTDDPQTEFQAEGFVLLQETGEQVQTTENGEFTFVDLEPGTYTLRVQAEGHEAVPQSVRVVEGEFAEKSIIARRTVSDQSSIVTQQYSVFVPCSIRTVENGRVMDCTFDQSGDSYRAYFQTNLTSFGDNVTYMVTEMQANQVAGYRVQIRNTTTDPWTRYASATDYETDYIRIVNEYGVPNEAWNFYGDNVGFNNSMGFQTILFVLGEFEEEANSQGFCCGAGVVAGVQAEFVQTVFLGPPEVDVESYCVLCQ